MISKRWLVLRCLAFDQGFRGDDFKPPRHLRKELRGALRPLFDAGATARRTHDGEPYEMAPAMNAYRRGKRMELNPVWLNQTLYGLTASSRRATEGKRQ